MNEKALEKKIELNDIVKRDQMNRSLVTGILEEGKIKIYEDDKFYIIKSNQFRDWTTTQALNDAQEEIGLALKKIKEN